LSKILGVFYALDLGIHAIRASTTSTTPAIAVDVFTVSFADKPLASATSKILKSALTSVLNGSLDYETFLRDKGKDPGRKQNHFSYTFLEGNPAILEVQAPKGRGMAYRLSRLIAGRGWNITAARVGQWAGRGTAAFYLQAGDGHKLGKGEVERALV